ncbi:N-acetyllactosaminide beta-1,3-N-acetylglucosaminyltransferase [Pimephales promelas]|nr:N-acetyllactosaminide beta-1,3-N-acetylglucosaminyltransferase [Pimephales promelas]
MERLRGTIRPVYGFMSVSIPLEEDPVHLFAVHTADPNLHLCLHVMKHGAPGVHPVQQKHFTASGLNHSRDLAPHPVKSFWRSELNSGALWNIIQFMIDSHYNPILNPHLAANPPDVCDGGPLAKNRAPMLLLAIKAQPLDFMNREAIRETWGRSGRIKSRGGRQSLVRRVFLLGKSKDLHIEEKLQLESDKYGDIIQWDFMDTLFNLTLKDVLFWDWFSRRCPHARFIFKGDDDIFVRTPALLNYLLAEEANENFSNGSRRPNKMETFVVGDVINNASPIRSNGSKYYIPESFFKGTYPSYPGGGGVVYSGSLAHRLLEVSQKVHLFPIDDVYLGMCLQRLGVYPIHHPAFLTFDFPKNELKKPCANHTILLYMASCRFRWRILFIISPCILLIPIYIYVCMVLIYIMTHGAPGVHPVQQKHFTASGLNHSRDLAPHPVKSFWRSELNSGALWNIIQFMIDSHYNPILNPHLAANPPGDDDIFVRTPALLNYLLAEEANENFSNGSRRPNKMETFVVGDVINNASPIRSNGSKYYIPESFFKGTYPSYPGGGGVVYSGSLAHRLLEVSQKVHLFPIDDVYLGMCLQRLGVYPIHHPAFLTFDFPKNELKKPCANHTILLVHKRSPAEIKKDVDILDDMGERQNNLTSFDPEVLAKLSRHTDEVALATASHSFMEVIAITSQDL